MRHPSSESRQLLIAVAVMCAGCVFPSACGSPPSSSPGTSSGSQATVRITGLMCDGEMLAYDCDDNARKTATPRVPIPGGTTTITVSNGPRVSATADKSGKFSLSIADVGLNSESYVEFAAESRQGLRIRRISTDACFSPGEHFHLVRLPAKSCGLKKS